MALLIVEVIEKLQIHSISYRDNHCVDEETPATGQLLRKF
jgi:hypothetical protein